MEVKGLKRKRIALQNENKETNKKSHFDAQDSQTNSVKSVLQSI